MRFPFYSALTRPAALAAYPYFWVRFQVGRLIGLRRGVIEMSDPQWGKRAGNEGPPDLDEIVRKFNQKLGSLFGRRGAEPPTGGASGGGGAGAIGGGFAFAGGLAVSVWLASGFYIVDQGSRGVELRLGRYTQTTQPGPRWHWPYPIETVEKVNVELVRAIEIGHRNNQRTKVKEEALMLTEDQNIVDVQFAVQYTLKSPEEFLFNNVFQRGEPDEVVRQVAETAMREIVGKSKMDFVLYEGRGDISARTKVLMQGILDRYKTGIQISTVNLQNAQPPAEVQASFDDAVRAKQDRERLKNEGEAYANDILPKARGYAARLIEEANGHKQRVIANAQGDASRFSQILTEYEKAPAVTRERMYLDVMQQVLQSTSKVYVDQKGGQNLLYLPLDKIMQMSSQGAAVSDTPASRPPASSDTPAQTITPADPVRRDLRSRDNR
jgi:membrane protease subunit HflK